ncbi:transmembrane protein [Tieghemostelium lacteum]|uniref:Phospholipid-transporting ATPase n=1 Tax=Tieghemostelium lacteum TaxID=361077 RepID=A0A151ZIJ3_TIELA|nr:transmembrane protein [Tieghemostelium lacteum]|eukprot:KYQ93719.1 transmembrane protein [Tieghemostelium lacteum]
MSDKDGAINNCYTLYFNDERLTHTQQGKKFPNNYIRTTKYTLLTFVPKNLFEQFRRLSNFYFLCVLIIQLVPQISPLLPLTSILPLSFVLIITATKEALEDYRRYQSDKKSNKEIYSVVKEGSLQSIYSQDIKVGDIIKIPNGQQIPSDLVLLSSSHENGLCYVETSNLDGETNLKVRKSLTETNQYQTPQEISQLRGSIVYESPNERLYRFNGRMVLQGNDSNIFSINHTMFLQRGSQLRNTKFIYGVCVYAGIDTKLFLNQQPPPSKFSTVEKLLNQLILFVFLFQIIICLLCAVASSYYDVHVASLIMYLGESQYETATYAVRNFFTYFILFNTMIPISLWVTLEMVKVGQAKFMEWDKDMTSIVPVYNPTTGIENEVEKGCRAKTSNLNEDLGRIQHIFSDKTGTLTENIMKFCKCSIGMDIYDEKENPGSLATALDTKLNTLSTKYQGIQSFLRVLCLCHTVVSEIEESSGNITYQSQSPDELALVNTASNNGYVFLDRKTDEILVREGGVNVSYQLLAVLEFSSARRRMSVIVRTPEGTIKLLTKGADMAITCRLAQTETSRDRNSVRNETFNFLKTFSRDGLRTLMLAERDLSQEEYDEWKESFFQANTSIENREEKVEAVCELIEKDLNLIGTTAIEDKLQNQVPETINYFLNAGLHIWVLTGDKQETAVNIGYSCRLFDPSMELIFLNTETSEECGQILDRYIALLPPETDIQDFSGVHNEGIKGGHGFQSNRSANPLESFNPATLVSGSAVKAQIIQVPEIIIPTLSNEYGLVVDGHTLSFALQDHKDKFLRLGRACKSVICCRVTPLQKALVVRVVKEAEKKISLAIGDGANDVSMIQESHVGVGIIGKEGTQAARASDYSIHQFAHLKRLLCVHGRYSYIRVSGLIQYSFYKNMSFTLCLLWYSFTNCFTGQTLFDSWIITFYNILFTSLPPFFYGLFEKDVDEESILENPMLYKNLQKREVLSKRSFLIWNLAGLWHSLVIFFGTKFLFSNDVMDASGHTAGIWTLGTIVATTSILTVNFRMSIEIKTWNIFNLFGILISLLAYFIMVMLYAFFLPLNANMYDIFTMELQIISYHLLILILVFVALIPDFIVKYYSRQYYPKDVQIFRERKNIKEIPMKEFITSENSTNYQRSIHQA